MKLQIILKNEGFVLIEIIFAVVIVSSLFLLNSFLNQENYNQKSLEQEKLLLISVLQKARNRAMNNIDISNHGLHIDDKNYILFRKIPYNKYELTNENVKRNSNIKINSSSNLLNNNEIEIIFTQLSGEPINVGQIELSDEIKKYYIDVISGGLINW